MTLPQIKLEFIHISDPFDNVATYEGSMSGIRLVTEVRPGSDLWGPGFANATAGVSLTRTQANADAAAVAPQTNAQLAAWARPLMDQFNDSVFIPQLSLAPIQIGGLNVSLCTACGRYAGDQRYTETFNVA